MQIIFENGKLSEKVTKFLDEKSQKASSVFSMISIWKFRLLLNQFSIRFEIQVTMRVFLDEHCCMQNF